MSVLGHTCGALSLQRKEKDDGEEEEEAMMGPERNKERNFEQKKSVKFV